MLATRNGAALQFAADVIHPFPPDADGATTDVPTLEAIFHADPADEVADDAATEAPTRWPTLPRKRRFPLRRILAAAFGAVFAAACIGGGALLARSALRHRPAAAAPVWSTFDGPRFTVDLPGRPTAQSSSAGVAGARLTATTWTAGTYGIGQLARPAGPDPVATGLALAATANNATVASVHRSQIGPYATADATLRTDSGAILSVRVMAGPADLWTLMAAGIPGGWNAFLRSFSPTT